MEEGTRTKKTVFIGGVAEEVDESTIYENFSTFGTLWLSCCIAWVLIGDTTLQVISSRYSCPRPQQIPIDRQVCAIDSHLEMCESLTCMHQRRSIVASHS